MQRNVFRGVMKECEEDINAFLSGREVRVVHMTQSETGDPTTVTLLVESVEPQSENAR